MLRPLVTQKSRWIVTAPSCSDVLPCSSPTWSWNDLKWGRPKSDLDLDMRFKNMELRLRNMELQLITEKQINKSNAIRLVVLEHRNADLTKDLGLVSPCSE